MIQKVLFLAVFLSCGLFVASRTYFLLVKGRLNVKGILYSREGTPVQYWILVATSTVGALLILGLASMLAAVMIGG